MSVHPGVVGPLAALLLLGSTAVGAQELSPRAYWPAPVGTQVLTAGLAHTSGDTVPDPSLPITGVDSSITSLNLAYSRTLSVAGRTSWLQFELPYATGDTRAQPTEGTELTRDYQGVGDISATFGINIFGAPAMDREGFAKLRADPHPILGASLKIVAPTGKYEDDRLINVGTNRWAAKAELGYMRRVGQRWLLEAQAGVWVFGDNPDFVRWRKEQEPIAAVELHLIRRFSPGFWGALDANFYRGGRSSLDGRELNDLQRDSKVGATLAFPLGGGHLLRGSYAFGSVNDSDERFQMFVFSYSKVF